MADPLGGVWAIEALTDDLVAGARAYIARIDEMGGALAALEHGFQQNEIADAAYAFAARASRRATAKVVGVNCFEIEDEACPRCSSSTRPPSRQVERLRELRRPRRRPRRGPRRPRRGATAENLMPAILDAVRAETTLGEIADALRGVFGEHPESGSSR